MSFNLKSNYYIFIFICSVSTTLYLDSFWSAFNINVFEFISIRQLLLTALFPMILIMGHSLLIAFSFGTIWLCYIRRKKFEPWLKVLLGITLVMLGVFSYLIVKSFILYSDYDYYSSRVMMYVMLSFTLSIFMCLFFINLLLVRIADNTPLECNSKIIFVGLAIYISFLIPPMFGRYVALMKISNSFAQPVVSCENNTNECFVNIYIGKLGENYIFKKLDEEEIRVVKVSNVNKLEFINVPMSERNKSSN